MLIVHGDVLEASSLEGDGWVGGCDLSTEGWEESTGSLVVSVWVMVLAVVRWAGFESCLHVLVVLGDLLDDGNMLGYIGVEWKERGLKGGLCVVVCVDVLLDGHTESVLLDG